MGANIVFNGRNISKTLGKRKILHRVDLAVHPGEITVVIGPSGAGKSTLIKCLSLLDPPDSGSVTIDDEEYVFPMKPGENIGRPYPKLTVVFQQLFLWPHLTLRQNISLPTQQRNGLNSVDRLKELIDLFDMGEFIDRYPNRVSLGQRQRAALARALILEPSYILLDEITSALDVEQTAAILKHLRTLRDSGIGICIVTHLLGFARSAANRVLFLDRGEVLESGGKELLVSPQHTRVQQFLSVLESVA